MAVGVRRPDRAHGRAPHRALASRLRGRPRGRGGPRARHASLRRGGHQAGGDGPEPGRLPHASPARERAPACRWRSWRWGTRVRRRGYCPDSSAPAGPTPATAWRPGRSAPRGCCNEFGFRRIGSHTAIYGVLGRPVAHSISPAMHNAAFRAAHIDAVYLPLAAASFDDFVAFAEAIDLAGASVTAPFKVEAFERADESDPVGRRIQSVNTLRRNGARWLACNTDVAGFLEPLEAAVRVERPSGHGARRRRRRPVGGHRPGLGRRASHDCSAACRAGEGGRGAHGRGHGPLAARPRQLGPARQCHARRHPSRAARLAVAATGFPSMAGSSTTWSTTRRSRGCWPTRRAAGCRTIGGLDMLVAQAQAQFEWWTERRPSPIA